MLLNSLLLAAGLELVDTPGTGPVHAHDREAEGALAAMDAAVFVLTGDPPISASERDLLVQVADASVRTFVILNKIDRLDDEERAHAHAFVSQVVAEAVGDTPQIYPCSAREALDARHRGADDRHTGVPAFEAEFARYLQGGGDAELQRSLTWRARLLAEEMLDRVRLTLRVGAMRTGEGARRVEEFRRRLDRIARQRSDAEDLATPPGRVARLSTVRWRYGRRWTTWGASGRPKSRGRRRCGDAPLVVPHGA